MKKFIIEIIKFGIGFCIGFVLGTILINKIVDLMCCTECQVYDPRCGIIYGVFGFTCIIIICYMLYGVYKK